MSEVLLSDGNISLLSQDKHAENFYTFSGPVRCTSGFISEMTRNGLDYRTCIRRMLYLINRAYPAGRCDYLQIFLIAGKTKVYIKSDFDSRIDIKEYGDYASELGITVLLPSEN